MSGSPASSRPLDARFSADIQVEGAFPYYLELEGSEDVLQTRRAVKVTGTLDGHPFAATLMPSGSGPHWLPLRKALRQRIGKEHAGAPVEVHLQERTT